MRGTLVCKTDLSGMDNDVIAHMRDRIRRLRRIAAMAHDPSMIEMLLKLAQEGEQDVQKLEAARKGGGSKGTA